jgi:hypothetical protein
MRQHTLPTFDAVHRVSFSDLNTSSQDRCAIPFQRQVFQHAIVKKRIHNLNNQGIEDQAHVFEAFKSSSR